jgi:cytochrome c biogenesis protein CcdA
MGHQTPIGERNGSPETAAPRAMARHVGEFAHDVVTLAELQAQLLATDVRECSQRALVPGLALLCGVALGFACFPIALAALALLLIQEFEMSHAAGFLVAFAAGAALSGLLCAVGWFQIVKRVAVLRRSQQELVRNLCWIKKVLVRSRATRKNSIDNSWRTVK